MNMNYTIRELENKDFQQLMELYTHLHEKDIPEMDERVSSVWESILADKNHHIIVAELNGKIISSCVCVIIPNLTRNQRPYAFVENVVTHSDFRGKGIATACLNYARDIAKSENCYKLMLLTGSKNENTLNFYRRAGYNSEDKTAFIQWLE
jgi:ribosomal protein S18 acetylase RimI-like enzyme